VLGISGFFVDALETTTLRSGLAHSVAPYGIASRPGEDLPVSGTALSISDDLGFKIVCAPVQRSYVGGETNSATASVNACGSNGFGTWR
jgi:hypothetical protein